MSNNNSFEYVDDETNNGEDHLQNEEGFITLEFIEEFNTEGKTHNIQSLKSAMMKLVKSQLALQNRFRCVLRENIYFKAKVDEYEGRIDGLKTDLVNLANDNIKDVDNLNEEISNLKNKLAECYQDSGQRSPNPSKNVSNFRRRPEFDHGRNYESKVSEELISLLPIFKNDGQITPPRFIADFERVVDQYGLNGTKKVLFFINRIRVPNPIWDMGLHPSDCEYEDYKGAFMDAYWGKEAQKTLKRKFLDSKIEFKGAAALQMYLKNWYNQLSMLTYGKMGTEEIVGTMIEKFPRSCQNLLQVIDHSDFSTFVERAIQVVREDDFRKDDDRRTKSSTGQNKNRDVRENDSREVGSRSTRKFNNNRNTSYYQAKNKDNDQSDKNSYQRNRYNRSRSRSQEREKRYDTRSKSDVNNSKKEKKCTCLHENSRTNTPTRILSRSNSQDRNQGNLNCLSHLSWM